MRGYVAKASAMVSRKNKESSETVEAPLAPITQWQSSERARGRAGRHAGRHASVFRHPAGGRHLNRWIRERSIEEATSPRAVSGAPIATWCLARSPPTSALIDVRSRSRHFKERPKRDRMPRSTGTGRKCPGLGCGERNVARLQERALGLALAVGATCRRPLSCTSVGDRRRRRPTRWWRTTSPRSTAPWTTARSRLRCRGS